MKKMCFIIAISMIFGVKAVDRGSALTSSIKNRRLMMNEKNNNNGVAAVKKQNHEQRDRRQRTRVHHAAIAADWVALDGYLGAGDDPNAHDIYGNTPLHYVVMYNTRRANRQKALYTLLGFGADIYSRNNRGYTPTEYASNTFFRRIILTFDQLTASVSPTLGDI